MKKQLFSGLALAAVVAAPLAVGAQSAPSETQTVTSVDRQFVQQAMQSNAEELKTGAAEQHSSDANVRLFAQTMVRDHGTSVAQLAAIANQLGISYPKEGVTQDVKNEGAPPQGENSTATSGNVAAQPAPPHAYMQTEVGDHQKAIALYENEMKNGSNEQLRTYAGKTLPILKNHLSMAEQYMRVGRITPEPAPTPCQGTSC